MGTRDRTVAALVQAGAVVVDSTDELAQAAALLSMTRLPPSPQARFGLVTGQAGPGLLIADGLKSAGVALPELGAACQARVGSLLPPLTFVKNPVDTGRPGPSFSLLVMAVGEQPEIDVVLVFGLHEPDVLNPVEALSPVARDLRKPVIFGSLALEEDLGPLRRAMQTAGLPLAESPERLVLAARVLAADARAQWRLKTSAAVDVPADKAAVARPLSASLDEDAAKRLLESHGLATPDRRRCTSHAEAQRALIEMAGPVAVKIASTEVLHKTESGGVHLIIADAAQLDAALAKLDRIPLQSERAYLLERMAPAGVDLIVGGVRDPSWGPCVALGLGGITAEALHDTAVRLAPLTREDVEEMLQSLRGVALLDGFRGLPVCDRSATADAVFAIVRLMAERPEIQEIEVNPLRVYAGGALALDALVVAEAAQAD